MRSPFRIAVLTLLVALLGAVVFVAVLLFPTRDQSATEPVAKSANAEPVEEEEVGEAHSEGWNSGYEAGLTAATKGMLKGASAEEISDTAGSACTDAVIVLIEAMDSLDDIGRDMVEQRDYLHGCLAGMNEYADQNR